MSLGWACALFITKCLFPPFESHSLWSQCVYSLLNHPPLFFSILAKHTHKTTLPIENPKPLSLSLSLSLCSLSSMELRSRRRLSQNAVSGNTIYLWFLSFLNFFFLFLVFYFRDFWCWLYYVLVAEKMLLNCEFVIIGHFTFLFIFIFYFLFLRNLNLSDSGCRGFRNTKFEYKKFRWNALFLRLIGFVMCSV